MASSSPSTIVGCLLDVSASMRETLEADHLDEQAIDRLNAVLRAGLKLAKSEHSHNPDAYVFIGLFGLDTDKGSPPAIDLCEAADALMGSFDGHQSGHDLLIARANAEGVPHITKYIRRKLKDNEARIVHAYLERHPDKVREFVRAIPTEQDVRVAKEKVENLGSIAGRIAGTFFGPVGPIVGPVVGPFLGKILGKAAAEIGEDRGVENSEALELARHICAKWLLDFTDITPRPVSDVIRLLEQLQEHSQADENAAKPTLLNTLRQHMYGRTPMRNVLERSLRTFKKHPGAKRRVLVLMSDGLSTDGDPSTLARELRQAKVDIATIYLTSGPDSAQRCLHYKQMENWHRGRCVLFNMATRVAGVAHPIPALASVGWDIPSAGEVALHAAVSTSEALYEISSLLLSARLGSADFILDLVGRFKLDEYVNDKNIRGYQNPSDQGQESICYAHAAAAVICMAMHRIVGREGGYCGIETVRQRILDAYPTPPDGHIYKDILTDAAGWYRLRVQEVDEDAARQAVLHRRPVLATFCLSESGWETFLDHFAHAEEEPITTKPILTQSQMMQDRSLPSIDGHAVVLIDCKPNCLTFLNSWGRDWGNNGSFSVESHTVLESDWPSEGSSMQFYDVYWLQDDLTAPEHQAYNDKVDTEVSRLAKQYPGILDLQLQCPHCQAETPLSGFVSTVDSIRQVQCVNVYEMSYSADGFGGDSMGLCATAFAVLSISAKHLREQALHALCRLKRRRSALTSWGSLY